MPTSAHRRLLMNQLGSPGAGSARRKIMSLAACAGPVALRKPSALTALLSLALLITSLLILALLAVLALLWTLALDLLRVNRDFYRRRK